MSFDFSGEHPDGNWRSHDTQERTAMNTFVATGAETHGEFGLFDTRMAPGQGAVPHYHKGFSESFFIISGELRLRAGDKTQLVRPGDFVYVPPRGIHVFRNEGPEDARFLILFSPGAPCEQYFREMAELATRAEPPTQEEIDEIAARHDQTNLRDPHWALP